MLEANHREWGRRAAEARGEPRDPSPPSKSPDELRSGSREPSPLASQPPSMSRMDSTESVADESEAGGSHGMRDGGSAPTFIRRSSVAALLERSSRGAAPHAAAAEPPRA